MANVEEDFVSLHALRMRLVYFSTSSMFLTIVLLPALYLFNPPRFR
jgi:hypothetical protein